MNYIHNYEAHDDHSFNTKHLYNICTVLVKRRRSWTNIVEKLYKCFVFDDHPSV